MLTKGPAKKVTIFINEDTQRGMMALHDSIMTFLMHKGISGATATRAYSGFGSHQMLHTTKVEVLTHPLPIRIEFVDTPAKVEEVLPTLYEMVSDGLIEVQDTNVIKHARKMPKPEMKHSHEKKLFLCWCPLAPYLRIPRYTLAPTRSIIRSFFTIAS